MGLDPSIIGVGGAVHELSGALNAVTDAAGAAGPALRNALNFDDAQRNVIRFNQTIYDVSRSMQGTAVNAHSLGAQIQQLSGSTHGLDDSFGKAKITMKEASDMVHDMYTNIGGLIVLADKSQDGFTAFGRKMQQVFRDDAPAAMQAFTQMLEQVPSLESAIVGDRPATRQEIITVAREFGVDAAQALKRFGSGTDDATERTQVLRDAVIALKKQIEDTKIKFQIENQDQILAYTSTVKSGVQQVVGGAGIAGRLARTFLPAPGAVGATVGGTVIGAAISRIPTALHLLIRTMQRLTGAIERANSHAQAGNNPLTGGSGAPGAGGVPGNIPMRAGAGLGTIGGIQNFGQLFQRARSKGAGIRGALSIASNRSGITPVSMLNSATGTGFALFGAYAGAQAMNEGMGAALNDQVAQHGMAGVNAGKTYWSSALGGGIAGAAAGSVLGPWGAAAGALVGVTTGLVGAFKNLQDAATNAAKGFRDAQKTLEDARKTQQKTNEGIRRDWSMMDTGEKLSAIDQFKSATVQVFQAKNTEAEKAGIRWSNINPSRGLDVKNLEGVRRLAISRLHLTEEEKREMYENYKGQSPNNRDIGFKEWEKSMHLDSNWSGARRFASDETAQRMDKVRAQVVREVKELYELRKGKPENAQKILEKFGDSPFLAGKAKNAESLEQTLAKLNRIDKITRPYLDIVLNQYTTQLSAARAGGGMFYSPTPSLGEKRFIGRNELPGMARHGRVESTWDVMINILKKQSETLSREMEVVKTKLSYAAPGTPEWREARESLTRISAAMLEIRKQQVELRVEKTVVPLQTKSQIETTRAEQASIKPGVHWVTHLLKGEEIWKNITRHQEESIREDEAILRFKKTQLAHASEWMLTEKERNELSAEISERELSIQRKKIEMVRTEYEMRRGIVDLRSELVKTQFETQMMTAGLSLSSEMQSRRTLLDLNKQSYDVASKELEALIAKGATVSEQISKYKEINAIRQEGLRLEYETAMRPIEFQRVQLDVAEQIRQTSITTMEVMHRPLTEQMPTLLEGQNIALQRMRATMKEIALIESQVGGPGSEKWLRAHQQLAAEQQQYIKGLDYIRNTWEQMITEQLFNMPEGSYTTPGSPSTFQEYGSGYFPWRNQVMKPNETGGGVGSYMMMHQIFMGGALGKLDQLGSGQVLADASKELNNAGGAFGDAVDKFGASVDALVKTFDFNPTAGPLNPALPGNTGGQNAYERAINGQPVYHDNDIRGLHYNQISNETEYGGEIRNTAYGQPLTTNVQDNRVLRAHNEYVTKEGDTGGASYQLSSDARTSNVRTNRTGDITNNIANQRSQNTNYRVSGDIYHRNDLYQAVYQDNGVQNAAYQNAVYQDEGSRVESTLDQSYRTENISNQDINKVMTLGDTTQNRSQQNVFRNALYKYTTNEAYLGGDQTNSTINTQATNGSYLNNIINNRNLLRSDSGDTYSTVYDIVGPYSRSQNIQNATYQRTAGSTYLRNDASYHNDINNLRLDNNRSATYRRSINNVKSSIDNTRRGRSLVNNYGSSTFDKTYGNVSSIQNTNVLYDSGDSSKSTWAGYYNPNQKHDIVSMQQVPSFQGLSSYGYVKGPGGTTVILPHKSLIQTPVSRQAQAPMRAQVQIPAAYAPTHVPGQMPVQSMSPAARHSQITRKAANEMDITMANQVIGKMVLDPDAMTKFIEMIRQGKHP